jgi:hypothetical protein
MAKGKQKAQSEQLALHMAKLPELHDMLPGSKSPVTTSKLVSSLQPKAGPSQASQVFFRPPTPAPASDSNDNMDDNFPYFGTKLNYNAKGEPIPVTPQQVKEILLASKWKDTIHLYQGAMPCLVRNSCKSDTCMVFSNIYDS